MSDIESKIEFLEARRPQSAPWNNGDVIEVGSLREYIAFEGELIEFLPHNVSVKEQWEGRKPLDQIITPKGFFGRICDISLVFTDAPYEYMQTQPNTVKNSLKDTVQTPGFAFGFAMQAGLHSTRGGNIGSLHVFVAYAPPVLGKGNKGGKFNRSSGAGAAGIRRVTTKPKVVTSKPIEQITQESIEIALKLQKNAVKHPYLGAFETRRGAKSK